MNACSTSMISSSGACASIGWTPRSVRRALEHRCTSASASVMRGSTARAARCPGTARDCATRTRAARASAGSLAIMRCSIVVPVRARPTITSGAAIRSCAISGWRAVRRPRCAAGSRAGPTLRSNCIARPTALRRASSRSESQQALERLAEGRGRRSRSGPLRRSPRRGSRPARGSSGLRARTWGRSSIPACCPKTCARPPTSRRSAASCWVTTRRARAACCTSPRCGATRASPHGCCASGRGRRRAGTMSSCSRSHVHARRRSSPPAASSARSRR